MSSSTRNLLCGLALLAATSTRANYCNVTTSGSSPELSFTTDFTTTYPAVSGTALLSAVGAELGSSGVLTQASDSGQHTSMFTTYKQQISGGFVAEFDYTFTGDADGFAFVIQNYGLNSLNGGTGGHLGFSGMDPIVAVAFDMCYDRTNCGTVSNQKISIYNQSNVLLGSREDAWEAQYVASTTLVGSHTVTIEYVPDVSAPMLTIYIDGEDVLAYGIDIDATVNLAAAVYDDNNIKVPCSSGCAYIGFTAATTFLSTADQTITSLKYSIPVPDTTNSRVVDPVPEKFELVSGQEKIVSYTVNLFDSCNAAIMYGSTRNGMTTFVEEGVLTFTLGDKVAGVDDVVDYQNGTYVASFTLTLADDGKDLTLSVAYDGTPVSCNGCDNVAVVGEPDRGSELADWIIALIVIILLIVLAAICYAAYRLYRYVLKWRENKDLIKEGKLGPKESEMVDQAHEVERLLRKVELAESEIEKIKAASAVNREALLAEAEERRTVLLTEIQRLKSN